MNSPEFFPYEDWINSQLSVARFYGCCEYNGEDYTIDMDTGDLVKNSFMKQYVKKCKADRLKKSAYTQAKERGELDE